MFSSVAPYSVLSSFSLSLFFCSYMSEHENYRLQCVIVAVVVEAIIASHTAHLFPSPNYNSRYSLFPRSKLFFSLLTLLHLSYVRQQKTKLLQCARALWRFILLALFRLRIRSITRATETTIASQWSFTVPRTWIIMFVPFIGLFSMIFARPTFCVFFRAFISIDILITCYLSFSVCCLFFYHYLFCLCL